MADVTLDYDEMRNAASRLTSTYDNMTTEMTALRAMVDTLVESGFRTDIASESFRAGFAEFNTGVTQTLKGLETMATYLRDYVTRMQEVDASGRLTVEGS